MRERILNRLAEFIWRHPWLVIALGAALAVVGVLYANATLRLNANTDDLISRGRPYMKEYDRLLEEFGDLEYLTVVVQTGSDAARTEEVVDWLTARLRRIPDLPGVYGSVTPEEQLRIASRAMPREELRGLVLASGAFQPILSADAAAVLDAGAAVMQRLVREGSSMKPEEQERLGAQGVFALSAIASAEPDSTSAKELAFLLGKELKPEYFKSDTGKLHFITIDPAKDYSSLSVIERPLQEIRGAIDEARRRFPGVEIGLTGKPVLQADEMATSNDDMTKASIVAFILCAVLFMLMIGGFVRPLLAVIAFAIGSAWTYGAAAAFVGQLNLLSIVFMLVLVGVGLDYGVHVISRYKEWRLTHDVHESVVSAMETAVRGNITGALTSSAVFFMALFTTFQGLRELGLIAGVGLILCLVAMATVLPAMLSVLDRRRRDAAGPVQRKNGAAGHETRAGVLARVIAHPGIVILAAAGISVALIAFPGRLRFERNLLKLQAEGLESIEWEHRVLADRGPNGEATSATWFGAIIAKDLDQVRRTIEAASTKPSIGRTHSILDVIPVPSPEREELQARLAEIAVPAASMPAASQPAGPARRIEPAALEKASGTLGLIALGAASRAPEEAKRLRELGDDLKSLAAAMSKESMADEARTRIDRNVRALGDSLRQMIEGNRLDLREALPDGLRRQFMSPRGEFLVMLHPKEDVWDYDAMKAFVGDLRAVDPNGTGAPITHFESLGEMLKSFIVMSALALLVILVIVALDFRSWRDVVLAMLPLAVGMLWTTEIMGLLDISFNLANFFAAPMLIGLGVDSSVHILHRYHEGGPQRFSLGSTRRAVILTALTTIVGFVTLAPAHHRGLRSLGLVMSIGSACCLVTSVVLLPALLAWLERRKLGKLAA